MFGPKRWGRLLPGFKLVKPGQHLMALTDLKRNSVFFYVDLTDYIYINIYIHTYINVVCFFKCIQNPDGSVPVVRSLVRSMYHNSSVQDVTLRVHPRVFVKRLKVML